MRTCGTWCTASHTEVETGLPGSAAPGGSPTNDSAPSVGTTVTSWPLSVNSRSSSTALYAAMPPETPSTTAGPAGAMRSDDRVRDLLVGEQTAVDLAERDRQRLLLNAGLDQ